MTPPPAQVWPTLRASDAHQLIDFLTRVLGFEATAVFADAETVHHAELSWPLGGGIMLGSAPSGTHRAGHLQPGTFSAYVVVDDADAHAQRMRSEGAEFVEEPHDTDYGSRGFTIRDPEGNQWSFGTYRGASK